VDLPGLGGDRPGRLGDGIPDLAEDAFGPAHEPPPGLGEPDGAADPLEEGNPDLMLQPGNLAADGRLVVLERFGRAAQVLQTRHLDEGSQKVGIDAIHASI